MRVIIIGGTAAGMSAAAKLNRTDKQAEVIVYEKRDYISFGACGLPYYAGGFFDKSTHMLARMPEQMQELGIEVKVLHEVVHINVEDKVLQVRDLASGNKIEQKYDKLMIATGATAIMPPIQNLQLENIFNLHTMEDGIKLKKALEDPAKTKIAIMGAGFIGLEVVEAAQKMGKEIYVFQRGDRVLNKVFDPEITTLLEEELRQKGVHLYTDTNVISLEGQDKVQKIVTSKGSFEVDIVVVAIGVRPATDFLKDIPIKRRANGAIEVDKYGETTLKDIYAAGDCATVPHMLKANAYIPLATSANKLGRLVGENLAGARILYQPTLGSSCIKVLDMEAARTGLTEIEAKENDYDVKTSFVTEMNQTGYYPGQSKIYIKLIYDARTKVILGAQMAGTKDVVQRVNVLACAIYNKMTTQQLGMLDLCYAPPFARTWDALNVAGNAAK